MIKKIFATLFLACAGFGLFAAEDVGRGSVYAGLALPQTYDFTAAEKDGVDSEAYFSWGINFGLRLPIQGLTGGFFLDSNWYTPYSYRIKEGSTETTFKSTDFEDAWGLDGLIGADFVLVNTGFLIIPVGVGAHVNYFRNKLDGDDDSYIKESALLLGLGGFVNAELAITQKINLYAGLRASFDFFQKTKLENAVDMGDKVVSDTKNSSSGVSVINIVPAIGAIFRF